MGCRFSADFIEILTEEEAKAVAGPHLARLRGCIEDGLARTETREAADSDFFHVYGPGPRATIVYGQIVYLAETRFGGIPGVSISHNRHFLTILIEERIEIRFKKLDRNNKSRNYPTKHQVRYQLQLRLVGMEEPTRATAGYKLNIDGSLKDILLVCPRGNENEWAFSLPADGDNFIAHPSTQDSPSEDDKPMVRPKQA